MLLPGTLLLLIAIMIVDCILCIEGRVLIELVFKFCIVRQRHGVVPLLNYLVVVILFLFEALVELLEDALVTNITLDIRLYNSRGGGCMYCLTIKV